MEESKRTPKSQTSPVAMRSERSNFIEGKTDFVVCASVEKYFFESHLLHEVDDTTIPKHIPQQILVFAHYEQKQRQNAHEMVKISSVEQTREIKYPINSPLHQSMSSSNAKKLAPVFDGVVDRFHHKHS